MKLSTNKSTQRAQTSAKADVTLTLIYHHRNLIILLVYEMHMSQKISLTRLQLFSEPAQQTLRVNISTSARTERVRLAVRFFMTATALPGHTCTYTHTYTVV